MKTRRRQAQPVGTLSKTLKILELICDSPKGLRLKEISEKTGFNKSTAYRFLAHLEREGYLVRNGSQSYVLGIRFMEMAARGHWVEGLRSIAWPFLLDLQRLTSETVNLALLDAGTKPVGRDAGDPRGVEDREVLQWVHDDQPPSW